MSNKFSLHTGHTYMKYLKCTQINTKERNSKDHSAVRLVNNNNNNINQPVKITT